MATAEERRAAEAALEELAATLEQWADIRERNKRGSPEVAEYRRGVNEGLRAAARLAQQKAEGL